MYSYTPRTVYLIRKDVTKNIWSALNVYYAWCNARQRVRNATQTNVTAVVVCCLQITQVCTTDLPIWEWIPVERNVSSVFEIILKNKLIITLNNYISFHVQVS